MTHRRLIRYAFLPGLWGALGLAFALQASEAALQPEDVVVKVAREVGPAVVSINTTHVDNLNAVRVVGPGGQRNPVMEEFLRQWMGVSPQKSIRLGMGSGVIVDSKGIIVTNEHVVAGAHSIEVLLSDGRKFKGEILGADTRSDLAVIRISGENLPCAKLGDSSRVTIGQCAIAIGNPFGFALKNPQPSVTVGVVSSVHRSFVPIQGIQGRFYGDLIQTDAAINIGNSGGPLLNSSGEVIGINTLVFSANNGGQGLGFAIPSSRVKSVLFYLVDGKPVPYGWLGIWIQTLDERLAQSLGLKDQKGALVFKLLRNGPGYRGGLQPGDIIRSFNDAPVLDAQDVTDKIVQARPGDIVRLKILRNGSEEILDITMGEADKTGEEVAVPSAASQAKPVKMGAMRGLVVGDITPAIAQKLRLSSAEGVVVTGVAKGSVAARAGLKPGDVIEEAAHQAVRSAQEFKDILGRTQGKILLRTDKGYLVLDEE